MTLSANYEIGTTLNGVDPSRVVRVVMADDDPQEHLLMAMAADRTEVPLHFDFFTNGTAMLTEISGTGSAEKFPAVIILDLNMPGLNGLQTLEELQAHPLMWQIPVVVFTSSSRFEDEARSYKRGAVWFETKPSTLSGMADFIGRLVTFANTDGYSSEEDSVLGLLNADLEADTEDRTLVTDLAIDRLD